MRRSTLYQLAWLVPLAGLAVLAGMTVWLCIRALAYPYQLLYGEGLLLEFSRRLAAGEAIYKPLAEVPLGTSNYAPLPLLLARMIFPLTGVSFAAGRMWAVLAAAAIAAILFAWVYRAAGSRRIHLLPGLVAALAWLGAPYVYHWAPQFRVDLPGLAFSLGGVYLVWEVWGRRSDYHRGHEGDEGQEKSEGGRRRLWAAVGAALLFVLALYCKQSFLAAPAAAFLYLLGRDRRSAAVLAGAAVLLGGVPFLILTITTQGAFWTSLVSSNVNPFDLELLASQVLGFLGTYLPLMVLAAVYVLPRGRHGAGQSEPEQGADRLIVIYLLLALATSALAGKVGSWENYFLEPLAALCLAAGLGIARLAALPRARWLAPALVALQVVLMWHTPALAVRMLREDAAANQVLIPQVAAASGAVLSEDAGLLVLAGKPVPYYEFQLSQLALAGRRDQSWEEDRLRNAAFPFVIFEGETRLDAEKYGRYTRAFVSALDYGYRPAERVGKYRIYRPATPDRVRAIPLGDSLALAAYTLPPAEARPGDRLALDVVWQATGPMTATYTSFAHVVDAAGQRVTGDDRQAWQGLYPTTHWAEGEMVRVGYTLTLPAELPPGLYTVIAGWYDEELNRLRTGTGADHVPLAVLQVPPAEPASPAGLTPLDATLGGARLAGYHVEQGPEELQVTLAWQPDAFLDTDYTVFVHLRNAAGETVAYGDAPPAGGTWPTSLWRPGIEVEDVHTISLPSGLPAGPYRLVVGLYDPATGQRVPLAGRGDEVDLGQVVLP